MAIIHGGDAADKELIFGGRRAVCGVDVSRQQAVVVDRVLVAHLNSRGRGLVVEERRPVIHADFGAYEAAAARAEVVHGLGPVIVPASPLLIIGEAVAQRKLVKIVRTQGVGAGGNGHTSIVRRADIQHILGQQPLMGGIVPLGDEAAVVVGRASPTACRQIRAVGLPHSATERLAKLLCDWSAQNGEAAKAEPRLKLALTHDEMAQMIGTSRETVTRLFADLKKRHIVEKKGSTLRIRNKTALKALALTQ